MSIQAQILATLFLILFFTPVVILIAGFCRAMWKDLFHD